MVSSDGFPPPRAAGTARASGCRSRKSAGSGHALDRVPQHPHLGHRARGHDQLGPLGASARGGREGRRTPQLAEDVEVTGGLAGQAPGGPGRHPHPGLHLGLGPVGPANAEAVGLALEVRAPDEVVDQSLGRLLPRAAPDRPRLVDDALDLGAHRRRDLARAGRVGEGPRLLAPGRPQPVAVLPARDQRGQGEQQHQAGQRRAGTREDGTRGRPQKLTAVTPVTLSTSIRGGSSRRERPVTIPEVDLTVACGCSSVGRARPSQGRCREFESRHPLQRGGSDRSILPAPPGTAAPSAGSPRRRTLRP